MVPAEEHLLGLAADFDARALKELSRPLLEVVAPDIADAQTPGSWEKEERDAEAATRLHVWDTPGAGSTAASTSTGSPAPA